MLLLQASLMARMASSRSSSPTSRSVIQRRSRRRRPESACGLRGDLDVEADGHADEPHDEQRDIVVARRVIEVVEHLARELVRR